MREAGAHLRCMASKKNKARWDAAIALIPNGSELDLLELDNSRLRELVKRLTDYSPPRQSDVAKACAFLRETRSQKKSAESTMENEAHPDYKPKRRDYVPDWTKPEQAIQGAVDAIEASGLPGENMTHAINLLHIARSLIADVVDEGIHKNMLASMGKERPHNE